MSAQLAICCGPVVTTWDCHSDVGEANSASFDTPIVDVSWNTSAQGAITSIHLSVCLSHHLVAHKYNSLYFSLGVLFGSGKQQGQ